MRSLGNKTRVAFTRRRSLTFAWSARVCLLVAALLFLFISQATTAWAANHSGGTLGGKSAWATDYFIQESEQPGPTVIITGGLHGNEPAGAYAANQIRHWPITRGRIVILPRANVAALGSHSRYSPGVDRAERNLNRNFPRSDQTAQPQGGAARGELANAIWGFVKEQKPDWLVDLHEGYDFHISNSKSVGSSILIHPSEATERVAPLMLETVNRTVATEDKKFELLRSLVDGGLSRAAAEHLGANAMTIETTTKKQPLSLRARQQRIAVHQLLRQLDMIDASVTPNEMTDRAAQDVTKVALYDAKGTGGKGVPRVVELLKMQDANQLTKPSGKSTENKDSLSKTEQSKRYSVQRVGPEDIRAGVLSQFDVVIFSGGTGSGQGNALGEAGRREVKNFVEGGAGYVGICAGAYLACDSFSWGLKILDAKTASPKWRRGKGQVKLELTNQGRDLLGEQPEQFDVLYANGPILVPAGSPDLPDYQPLAMFRTELSKHGTPPGVMIDTAAIVAGRCGKGRVVCFSPHPEQTRGLGSFIVSAIDWTTRDESE